MIGKKKYLLFIIFIVSVNLFSKERMNIDLPVDEKKEWVIGVSTLSGDNLPVEYSYLLSSIPLLILEQLSSCKDHVLSKNEIKKTCDLIARAEEFSKEFFISKIREKI